AAFQLRSVRQHRDFMQQVLEIALGAAAVVDQAGRGDLHVLGDVKLVRPDALDHDVAFAAAHDEVVLLRVGADILETFIDEVGQGARRLVLADARQRPRLELLDVVAHPTLPSRLIEMSFCASTANSIGNCCSTSLTKPLTTSAVASSAD